MADRSASQETIDFYTRVSDSVLLCVFILPLLSLLVYFGYKFYAELSGASSSNGKSTYQPGSGQKVSLEKDVEEEKAIKASAGEV